MSWQCMFCRCTPDDPCRLGDGEECGRLKSWATCCTNPHCIVAFDKACARGEIATAEGRREERLKGLRARQAEIVRRREGKGQRQRRRPKVKGRAA